MLSLQQLHIIGREHSVGAIRGKALPPACINLVNVDDDVVRVKGDLCVVSCNRKLKFSQMCNINHLTCMCVVTVNLSNVT